MLTYQDVKCFLENNPTIKNFYIGFSGGIDSVSLLHALTKILKEIPDINCYALFANHGLSKQTHFWQQHCEKICKEYAIAFTVLDCHLGDASGESIEARARELRYKAFEKYITHDSCLVTAHHEDDQAETLLLQLFRGAGVKGLASMRKLGVFSQGFHWRPLLEVKREEIEVYAKQNALVWVDDEANDDLRFDRNFLHKEIIPALKTRWPAIGCTISRTAVHCQHADDMLQEIAAQDLQWLLTSDSKTLSARKLAELSHERCLNVLRFWIQSYNLPLPSLRKCEHIIRDVINSRYDKSPCVSWPGGEVRRFRDECYLFEPFKQTTYKRELEWLDLNKPLSLPSHIGILSAELKPGGILIPDTGAISIRFRQGGEVIQPVGRGVKKSLKCLFQEWNIPPWERSRIPLLYYRQELIAVIGYTISQAYRAAENEMAWQFYLNNKN